MEPKAQAIRQMWEQIQSLQTENRRLRGAIDTLGHSAAVLGVAETPAMASPPFAIEQMIFEGRAGQATALAWPAFRREEYAVPAPMAVGQSSAYVPAYSPAPMASAGAAPAPELTLAPAPAPAPAPAGVFPGNIDVGVVRQLSVEQLDKLPYGVMTLDREGTVLTYNDTESRLANMPKDRVLMRNFFRDVAPCTQVKEFEGRYLAFTRGETRSPIETFDFSFHFKHGTQHVTIIFSPGRARGTFNVLMVRR